MRDSATRPLSRPPANERLPATLYFCSHRQTPGEMRAFDHVALPLGAGVPMEGLQSVASVPSQDFDLLHVIIQAEWTGYSCLEDWKHSTVASWDGRVGSAAWGGVEGRQAY